MNKDRWIRFVLVFIAGSIGGLVVGILNADNNEILKRIPKESSVIFSASSRTIMSMLLGVVSAYILVFFVTMVNFGDPIKLFALALVGGLTWQSIVQPGAEILKIGEANIPTEENQTKDEPISDPPPVIDKGSGRSKIAESMFCLGMKRPECGAQADLAEVYLNNVQTIEDGVRKLFFWTSMQANEDLQNVAHVWLSSERPDEWPETVRIWIHEKVKKFTVEDKIRLKRRLSEIEKTNPNMHSVQAVILSLHRSSNFRTYSSIRAVPGRYTVEVRYPNGQKIVPGGGPKTITIKPPQIISRDESTGRNPMFV